jgi:hypothetical protein
MSELGQRPPCARRLVCLLLPSADMVGRRFTDLLSGCGAPRLPRQRGALEHSFGVSNVIPCRTRRGRVCARAWARPGTRYQSSGAGRFHRGAVRAYAWRPARIDLKRSQRRPPAHGLGKVVVKTGRHLVLHHRRLRLLDALERDTAAAVKAIARISGACRAGDLDQGVCVIALIP